MAKLIFFVEELGTQVRKTELKAEHMAEYFASKQSQKMWQSSVVARKRWSGSVAGIDILEVIVTGSFSIGLGSYLEVPRDFGHRLGTLVF